MPKPGRTDNRKVRVDLRDRLHEICIKGEGMQAIVSRMEADSQSRLRKETMLLRETDGSVSSCLICLRCVRTLRLSMARVASTKSRSSSLPDSREAFRSTASSSLPCPSSKAMSFRSHVYISLKGCPGVEVSGRLHSDSSTSKGNASLPAMPG